MICQRSRFALEGYFLGFIPWQEGFHAIGQMAKLIHGQVGRCATAEINKVGLASADEWFSRVNVQLSKYSLEITTNGGRIFICINLEVTEMTALPAKRNM